MNEKQFKRLEDDAIKFKQYVFDFLEDLVKTKKQNEVAFILNLVISDMIVALAAGAPETQREQIMQMIFNLAKQRLSDLDEELKFALQ